MGKLENIGLGLAVATVVAGTPIDAKTQESKVDKSKQLNITEKPQQKTGDKINYEFLSKMHAEKEKKLQSLIDLSEFYKSNIEKSIEKIVNLNHSSEEYMVLSKILDDNNIKDYSHENLRKLLTEMNFSKNSTLLKAFEGKPYVFGTLWKNILDKAATDRNIDILSNEFKSQNTNFAENNK